MEKDDDGSYRRQGKWEFFAESGWKAMEVTFKDGEKQGLQTEWFSNGEKMLEVTFEDGEKGPVTFWDKNGINSPRAPGVQVEPLGQMPHPREHCWVHCFVALVPVALQSWPAPHDASVEQTSPICPEMFCRGTQSPSQVRQVTVAGLAQSWSA